MLGGCEGKAYGACDDTEDQMLADPLCEAVYDDMDDEDKGEFKEIGEPKRNKKARARLGASKRICDEEAGPEPKRRRRMMRPKSKAKAKAKAKAGALEPGAVGGPPPQPAEPPAVEPLAPLAGLPPPPAGWGAARSGASGEPPAVEQPPPLGPAAAHPRVGNLALTSGWEEIWSDN